MPQSAAMNEPDSSAAALSPREEEIIVYVAAGKTNIEIAGILAISPFTVKNHVQRIIKKLGASNRTEAAVLFHRKEWQSQRTKNTDPRTTLLIDTISSLA